MCQSESNMEYADYLAKEQERIRRKREECLHVRQRDDVVYVQKFHKCADCGELVPFLAPERTEEDIAWRGLIGEDAVEN